jgi:hypothetical protein
VLTDETPGGSVLYPGPDVARFVLAGAGDRAAGRRQHAGTEDGNDSQGEVQSPQPQSKRHQNTLRSV